jgi:uncharacterized RDD family membrane protein YckC
MADESSRPPTDQAAAPCMPRESQSLCVAEAWKRFVNLIVDFNLAIFCTASLVWLAACIGPRSCAECLPDFASVLRRVSSPELADITFGLVQLVGLTLYYAIQEAAFGRTIGKLLTRTIVVSAGGGRATFAQVLVRTFSRLIPFEPFSYFFVGGNYPVGWHDNLSGTRVVDKPRRPIPNP